MTVTEQEASEIACPAAGQNFPNVKCRGHGCMAWRWLGPEHPRDPATRLGYCGLCWPPGWNPQ